MRAQQRNIETGDFLDRFHPKQTCHVQHKTLEDDKHPPPGLIDGVPIAVYKLVTERQLRPHYPRSKPPSSVHPRLGHFVPKAHTNRAVHTRHDSGSCAAHCSDKPWAEHPRFHPPNPEYCETQQKPAVDFPLHFYSLHPSDSPMWIQVELPECKGLSHIAHYWCMSTARKSISVFSNRSDG